MTYTYGFSFVVGKDVTKSEFIELCELLTNEVFFNNEYIFEPEPITEGGIIYRPVNNIGNVFKYKSIRFHNQKSTWPRINTEVLKEWRKNDDILFYKGYKFDTFLKSFGDSPLYTLEELKILASYFNLFGLIKNGKYPKDKDLMIKIR